MPRLGHLLKRWIAARSEPKTADALFELLANDDYGPDHLITEVSAYYELWYEGEMTSTEMMRELRRSCAAFLESNPVQCESDPPHVGDPPYPHD